MMSDQNGDKVYVTLYFSERCFLSASKKKKWVPSQYEVPHSNAEAFIVFAKLENAGYHHCKMNMSNEIDMVLL